MQITPSAAAITLDGPAPEISVEITRADALRARALCAVLLVEVMTDEPIRAFNGLATVTTPDGRIWRGIGTLGGLSAVATSERIESTGFEIGFNIERAQVEPETWAELSAGLAASFATDVVGRDVRAYLGIYTERGVLVENQLTIWASGVGAKIRRRVARGAISVVLECDNRLVAAFPARSLFLTDDDQRALTPAGSNPDKFLEFVAVIASESRNNTWTPGV